MLITIPLLAQPPLLTPERKTEILGG